MPIEGDLKSINFSSVLQTVAQEHLTGVLKIKKKSDVVDIGFADGQITGAFFERGDKSERLETYLVRSGIVGKHVYQMVEDIHNETKRPIMNILLEDKYLTKEEIERIIKFKIQEVIDEVFIWEHGAFTFEQGSVIYPKSMIKVRLDTEGIVMESARRMDEWPKIKDTITSDDIVYKKVERPELKLTPGENESRILSLLDGHRSVADLVEISGLGKFQTYSCLYRLLTTGQIEISYAKPIITIPTQHKKVSLTFLRVPVSIAVIVILLVLEFLLGNYVAQQYTIPIKLLHNDFYTQDHEIYQEIFYYRNNRTPSISEVEEVFGQYIPRN
ncbi:hypothetical protein AMJ87_05695 [candidate division WOR_3 bacterium SM23_60]|uniref:PatA-like N-terminal domain-containing protein n=1 Tax=candidate division WOR_3 bacterium SM23_60 TaxID=1703780 RepID=A0A0S8GGF4_UNCW3|nr:MAG: hypothetical protein AMJ87_05695 [candidate division WOR_3 bacterium SM23_60]